MLRAFLYLKGRRDNSHIISRRNSDLNLRTIIAPIIGVTLIGSICLSGCEVKRAEVQTRNAPAIENSYLGVLDELTAMMRDRQKEPALQLETLRVWVTANRERVLQTVQQLNQDVLAMSPEEREVWRKTARPELEKRLDAYAREQLAFQKKLNATQKWELGEILSQLK